MRTHEHRKHPPGWRGGGRLGGSATLRLHAMRARTMEPEETLRDLPSELWMNVPLQGGPALLSSCSRLCRQLHQAVSELSALQRRCAQECFAVPGCEPPARTSCVMRFCTAAGSGEAGPPCPPGRAASCRSHRADVPNPNPNPNPIANPNPAPKPSPSAEPRPKPNPTFVLLAARIR